MDYRLVAEIIAGSTIGIVLVWTAWRKVWPLLKNLEKFTDDWFGEDERPGVPAREGVMERIHRLEVKQHNINYQLNMIKREIGIGNEDL